MVATTDKNVEYLVADTTAFIQNAPLQNVGQHIVTCQEVVDEITSKRQLRRLVVLPYDLNIKNVDPENVILVTEFAKKTGDYPSLSATDIKVMALTYQLEKEHIGTAHLRNEPVIQRSVNVITTKQKPEDISTDITGFYIPGQHKKQTSSRTTSISSSINEQLEENKALENTENEKTNVRKDNENGKMSVETTQENTEKSSENEEIKQTNKEQLYENNINFEKLDKELSENFKTLECTDEQCLQPEENVDDILVLVEENTNDTFSEVYDESEDDEDDDEAGWITPSNVQKAKKQINSELMEEKHVKVACMTTDFAMQNVLKQMNLNLAALDGRLIKQLRTFILRCYTCFGTTSIMTKLFCPKCGNKTLKRVAVSLDEDGKQQIHINARRPLTARGKKFSLPRIQGGKHSNNPHLVEDQPIPDQRPTRLAKTKNNPLDDDYIAGYSPFVMRDVTSKSAQLKIRPASEVKHWMRKNPNEAGRRRKK